jgi:hypothetical protein
VTSFCNIAMTLECWFAFSSRTEFVRVYLLEDWSGRFRFHWQILPLLSSVYDGIRLTSIQIWLFPMILSACLPRHGIFFSPHLVARSFPSRISQSKVATLLSLKQPGSTL